MAQHRHHGCDSTSCRDEYYAFVACLVKIKLAIRPACFHCEARLREVIEKNRYKSIFHPLRRDLHIGLMDRRRGNSVGPRYSLAIDRPLERQKLPWLSTKPSFPGNLKSKLLLI